MALAFANMPAGNAYERPNSVRRISVGGLEDIESHNAGSEYVSSMSDNGRFVAFESAKNNLVVGDLNNATDVFVWDALKNRLEMVSVSSEGVQAIVSPSTQGSVRPYISASGRFVAFDSTAINLVEGDTNLAADVFVHDRRTGKTSRVSISSDGEQAFAPIDGEHNSWIPSISADGALVVFTSQASDLIPEDTNETSDVFLHDRRTGVTSLMSTAEDGTHGNAANGQEAGGCASIDDRGRFVAFTSGSDNLVKNDLNADFDVFVRDLTKGTVERVSLGPDGAEAGGVTCSTEGQGRTLSKDGRFVTFWSGSPSLIPADSNRTADVFVRDLQEGRTQRVSVSSTGAQTQGAPPLNLFPGSSDQYIGSDGRYVAFMSGADNFGSSQNAREAFVHDTYLGITQPVSIADESFTQPINCARADLPAVNAVWHPSISRDGDRVAFTSCLTFTGDESDLGSFDDTFVLDRGFALGTGHVGAGTVRIDPKEEPVICVDADICPGGAMKEIQDDPNESLSRFSDVGLDLYGAMLAYRPLYEDLFVAIEIENMPKVVAGESAFLYGLSFRVEDESYEIRASSLLGGTFGLFDCTAAPCSKVADLRGGYGTTGERIVFSLPLAEIGLEDGGNIEDIEAFSSIGTGLTGATKILDRVQIN